MDRLVVGTAGSGGYGVAVQSDGQGAVAGRAYGVEQIILDYRWEDGDLVVEQP